MPGLTDNELSVFLNEPGHLLRLGTIGTDGIPRVVPIWFLFDENKIWFTPRARSAWLDDLRENQNVCCTIDEAGGLLRKLVARGQATMEYDLGQDDRWRDRYRTITLRYTPESFADAYLSDTIEEPRALFSLDLSTAETATWRMPGKGEDRLAVWSKKYYHR